eukprot:jgi/Galph1/3417/GphlegSOOS_G2090.1
MVSEKVPSWTEKVESLLKIERSLAERTSKLHFDTPVSHCYNPLQYAWLLHEQYVRKFFLPSVKVLFVGINPGPFGMVQSGVPFGDTTIVKNWLGINGEIDSALLPNKIHPKRPIYGLSCPRREVSGQRLWGWARQGWGEAKQFFRGAFVYNYCPLAFMSTSGKNITPNNLDNSEKRVLLNICNAALSEVIDLIQPQVIIGLGNFAYEICRKESSRVIKIPHPSPANPASNKYWSQHEIVTADIKQQCLQYEMDLDDFFQ